ncbi:MAG: acyl-CoA thioesterase [Proteobacteria bacterium]|nr:acyl-CoA thioesterase [Pseudomonadota bacterium]
MQKNTQKPKGILAIQTLAMPADTNPNGDIFGGWLVSQMDLAAGVISKKRSNGRVVTVAIQSMVFHTPVKVGDLVCCYGTLEKVGRTSMTVSIEVWVIDHCSGEEKKVTEGVFVYVAIDEHGKPRPVDPN